MITYIVMITKIIMMIHLIIKVNVITRSDQVGGGGSFVVLPLERTGRVGQAAWKVNFLFVIVVTIPIRSHQGKDEKDTDYIFESLQVSGHAGPVLDIR